MNVGDIVKGKIESLASWGDGVIRIEGFVVLIPGTCVGEEVTACVTRVQPRFASAKIASIETASPDRITPVCRVPPTGRRIPGCIYDHISYAAELACKQAHFRSTLQGFTPLKEADSFLLPPVASPRDVHYQNKLVVRVETNAAGRRCIGVRSKDKGIIDIESHPLALDSINACLRGYRVMRDTLRDGSCITFRWTAFNGTMSWKDNPTEHLKTLKEKTCFGPLDVPSNGDFHTNPGVSALLIDEVIAHIKRHQPVCFVDTYSGVGTFALAAVRNGVETVYGVEHTHALVRLAECNAARLWLPARFLAMDAFEGVSTVLSKLSTMRRCCVFVDPPCSGLCATLRKLLVQQRPEFIFYVSCDPHTLARDLARFVEVGHYRILSSQIFDMSPRTAHFLSLTILHATEPA